MTETSKSSDASSPIFDEAVEQILKERYYVQRDDGTYETWEDLCNRVSTALEAQEPFNKTYTKQSLYNALYNREIMVGSPTLMNAGARLGMLSSCFIYSLGDSLEDIFNVVKDSAKTFQYGGGIGYDFSSLRPDGATIKSTGGYSSGPLSFMKVIDKTGEVVKGGGLRKAAIMSTMRIDHPDIEEFINIKRKESELNNMNLSVTITDEFMNCLDRDGDFDLRFEGVVYKTVKAKRLWDMIVDAAWQSGEPGVIFIDRVNEYNTTPEYGPITHPNPCSEFFQVHWNSCNLGSINLMSCVDEEEGTFRFYKLYELTRLLATALNKTIEINKYPIQKVADVTRALRPIGIGIFGTANVFIKMGMRYGSKEACSLLEEILDIINIASLDLSADYAKEFGVFDTYNYENFKFLKDREGSKYWEETISKIKKYGLYNCLTTTLMPTGTVSIIAGQGEANGIEPLFSTKVMRKFVAKNGQLSEMEVLAPAFLEYENNGGDMNNLPFHLVTKDDLMPKDHIRVLVAAQKHCQTGVSKTVNFSNSSTREDISDVYWHAYKSGCKSVSVYRDGSRSMQILNSHHEKIKQTKSVAVEYTSKTVPGKKVIFDIDISNGDIIGITPKTEGGELLTIGSEASRCAMINRMLRAGVPVEHILGDLKPDNGEYNLSTALYYLLRDAKAEATEKANMLVTKIEATPEFVACPTGSCSL